MSSPVVDGYTAVRLRVSGTNPGRDEEYTVLYLPTDQAEGFYTINDYETPLNLGNMYLQIGVCFE